MRVITDQGETIELGNVETTPTIGITDFSRRVTDDFGVTTVVERGFSRRMSVKLGVPIGDVDALQRRLATLRATPALWVADDRFASLSMRGFYKDFDLDLATPAVSYCTLTVEGLAETAAPEDVPGDPAPPGDMSTLQLIQPITVTDAVLASSTVPENDAVEWSSTATYALGARVMRATMHRLYENLTAGNVGNDPAGVSGQWLDVGPTNRWAMFDEALGTSTASVNSIQVVFNADAANAVALLDVAATSVRVRATGYDRTTDAGAGAITFLDLPADAGTVTVTIAGTGPVSVGTLLIGRVTTLGLTEASPTAGITDFSRKDVDQFGEVTIVERAWAKRMTARALIRTDAVDMVANRITAVRAQPSLWIGQTGLDSLTVYGFFKDFSIELGDTVSKLSLSIEGLSQAAPVVPFAPGSSVAWPDILDPDGTKPSNNADETGKNTSKDTNAVGGVPASDVLAGLERLDSVTIPAVNAAVAEATARIEAAQAAADAAVAAANERIAEAHAKLDQAVLDLAAEIDRAQGVDEDLTRRVDAITAGGTGPGGEDIQALVERIDLVRADGQRALATAIQNVATAYEGLDAATNSRISDQVTALSDARRSIAQRIEEVVTEFRGLDDETNVRIGQQYDALSDAYEALGRRIDTISASGGYDDTDVRAEIRRVDTAAIERDSAAAQSVAEVTSSLSRGGGNLLSNTDFVTTDGWGQNYNIPSPEYVLNAAGPSYHPVGENVLSIRQAGRAGGDAYYADWISDMVAVVPGSFLQFSAMFASHRANTQAFLGWVGTDGVIFAFEAGNLNSSTEALANDPSLYKRSGLVAVEAPARAVAARLLMRKGDTYDGQGDSYAWMWRPYIGAARRGQNSWNDWSPGSGRAVQLRSDAAIREAATTAATANKSVADLSTSVSTRFEGVNLTLGGYDQRITSLSNDQQGYVGRASTLEAQMSRQAPSALNDFTDAVNNRLAEVDAYASARIKSTEDVIADLPNRYSTAQRTEALEAQVNFATDSGLQRTINARIEDRATAIADAKTGAVVQTVNQLRAEYNNTAASVGTTAGAIADLQGRTAAYWRTTAVAGNNRAQITVSADANAGAGVDIIGDVSISGDLLVGGSVYTNAIAPDAFTGAVSATFGDHYIQASGPSGTTTTFDTGVLNIFSTGGRLRTDVYVDAYVAAGGPGRQLYVQLIRRFNGYDQPVSRLVGIAYLQGPCVLWAQEAPGSGLVGYFLRFTLSISGQGSAAYTLSQPQLQVMEFKR
ncbi:hypothetical protein [Sphingomonas aerolata]|uniref:hypothetical protein n=1 Tax=Sphingomonas aerolata TaxID=185951 RepID=UPI00141BE930|nr:hypothetical protein [Sphingomonas aerolata]NII59846.1 hypothetical protein [Sphingomonas aerolata]